MNLPRTLLLAAAATAIAAPVADAAKPPKITAKYHYKVELKGVMTTTWSLNSPSDGSACDATQTGKGKQVVRFSAKPARMYMYDGISPTMFVKKGASAAELEFKLRGTVNRSGSIHTGPPPSPESCPDGVPQAPPAPDCGTKPLKGLKVKPTYQFKTDRIVLEQADAYDAPEPFKNCPAGGSPYPYLIDTDDAGKAIGQNLPTEDLFKHGQNIVIARGTKTLKGELQSKTTIRWDLDFKRVKIEKIGQ